MSDDTPGNGGAGTADVDAVRPDVVGETLSAPDTADRTHAGAAAPSCGREACILADSDCGTLLQAGTSFARLIRVWVAAMNPGAVRV